MMMLFPKLTPVLSGYLDLLDLDTYIGVGRPIILIKEFLKSYPTVLIWRQRWMTWPVISTFAGDATVAVFWLMVGYSWKKEKLAFSSINHFGVVSKERVQNSWNILNAIFGHEYHQNHSKRFIFSDKPKFATKSELEFYNMCVFHWVSSNILN